MELVPPTAKPCRRCQENEATLKIRGEAICRPCYRRYVNSKCVKRLEKLAAEIRAGPAQTKRVLVGLSLGPSSAALVDILKDQIESHRAKWPTCSPSFDCVAVHVDVDLSAGGGGGGGGGGGPPPSQRLLDGFAARFPRFAFRRVPLSAAMELDTVDWAALAPAPRSGGAAGDAGAGVGPAARLRALVARLPSATARADVARLLVRHLLVATARAEGCAALVLGCSTTALAELALGEAAKGRGFSVPWTAGDGPLAARRGRPAAHAAPGGGAAGPPADAARLCVYYPNRELFRSELVRYTTLVEPPLTGLLSAAGAAGTAAVVSHRDVSIDDVMTRYFADVEEQYPSIVANVVRTTGKLERTSTPDERCCGLCGMGLDELGDERWKGEMGEGEGEDGRLCYGCVRALRG